MILVMSIVNAKHIYEYQYLYGLYDPLTGDLKYIGISVRPKERLVNHCNESSHSPKSIWIKSIMDKGYRPYLYIFEKIRVGDDWAAIEMAYIRFAIAIGVDLTNSTDGGEGVLNLRGEPKKRMLNTWPGRKHSQDSIIKIGIASKGRVHDESWRKNMSVKMKGRQIEWKDKLMKPKKLSADQVEEIRRLLNKGIMQKDVAKIFKVHRSTIQNITKGVGCYSNPEYKKELF